MRHAHARPTRPRDTRGTLRARKKACCASCAAGGPCEGGCGKAPSGKTPCSSCASGGGCEGERLPPGAYAGVVGPDHGAQLWLVGPALGLAPPRVRVVGSLGVIAPGEFIHASVVAPSVAEARRVLARRLLGDLGRRPRVARDTRGGLARPASYQALFWGPSDAEEKAFQELYKRYMRLLDHTAIVAQMKASSPTLSRMLSDWFSFAKLWLAGEEDPDQLLPRAQDLTVLETTARDQYGYDKPPGSVVVPMPYDSPVLETIDEIGEVLEDAGLPTPDPHAKDGLGLEGVVATIKSAAMLAAIGAGLYFAAPFATRALSGRTA